MAFVEKTWHQMFALIYLEKIKIVPNSEKQDILSISIDYGIDIIAIDTLHRTCSEQGSITEGEGLIITSVHQSPFILKI